MTLKLIFFFVDLILPMAVGFWFKRTGLMSEKTANRLMLWNLYTVATVLGGVSVWGLKLSWQMAWLPVLGVAMQMVAWGCGWVRVHKKFDDPLEKGAFLLACMLSNRGTVGVLTVFVILGETGYAICMMVMLLARFVVQLICFPMSEYYMRLGQQDGGSEKRPLWKLFVTPKQIPLLGIGLGLVLSMQGVERPAVLGDFFGLLVHPMAWFFMIPIGQGLDFSEMRVYWRRLVDLLAIKFVITPLIICGIAYLLPIDPLSRQVVVVLSCSPTAINAVITARIHNLNMHLVLAAFVMTTLVYMAVLLPLFVCLVAAR